MRMTAYMQHVALHALQKLGLPVREIGKRPEFGPDVHDAAGASSEELVMACTRHGRGVMTALVGWREEREERLLGVYVYEFGGRGDDDSIVSTDVEWRVITQPTELSRPISNRVQLSPSLSSRLFSLPLHHFFYSRYSDM